MEKSITGLVLHLIDFEKTVIQSVPLQQETKLSWCYNYLISEELSVFYSFTELSAYFSPYCNPDNCEGIEYRYEMKKLFNSSITLNTYIDCNKRVIQCRSPIEIPLKKRPIYVGRLGFKIEHYFNIYSIADGREYEILFLKICLGINSSFFRAMLSIALLISFEILECMMLHSIIFTSNGSKYTQKITKRLNQMKAFFDFLYKIQY